MAAETTGSTFGSWLEEEGIREEIEAAAARRVEEWQMAQQTTAEVGVECGANGPPGRSPLSRGAPPRPHRWIPDRTREAGWNVCRWCGLAQRTDGQSANAP